MTGRTHDLAAFTALGYIAVTEPLLHISFGTMIVAIGANLIGGIAPDIDQPTAGLYRKLPAGIFIGDIIAPLLGGHRFISHSLIGFALFGIGFHYILTLSSHTLIIDHNVVWWSFMIGYISHLIMDTVTREGVPWLFPIPFKFGFPPFKDLRIHTAGIVEKMIIFPGLIVVNGCIYYFHYHIFLNFLRHYVH